MFCKYILGLNMTTSNFCIDRELGAFPLDLRITSIIVAYWSSLMNNTNDSKLTTRMYKKSLYHLPKTNIYMSKWLDQVEKAVNKCGLTDNWPLQSE